MELNTLLGRNKHVITNILLSVLQMTESLVSPYRDQEKFQLFSGLWISKQLYKYCSFSYTLGLTITHWQLASLYRCTTVHHLKLTLDSKISSSMCKALTKYIPFSHYTDVTSYNMRKEGKKKLTTTKKINKTTNQNQTHIRKTHNTPAPQYIQLLYLKYIFQGQKRPLKTTGIICKPW